MTTCPVRYTFFFQVLGVSGVGVSVKAATDEGVSGRFPLADEDVTFEHLDARRAAHDARKQGRMVDVGMTGKRRVERKEAGDAIHSGGRRRRAGPRAVGARWHQDVTDSGAVMERFNGKESRDSTLILIHVLQQEAIGPDGEPGIDPFGPHGAAFWVQLPQRLL